tara:strand:- start:1308 stop:1583 length:276 start_codon:yes stop_codon:yes gene_type:complete
MSNKIEIWDHRLKGSLQETCSHSHDLSYGGKNYIDFKIQSDDIRMVGTDKQMNDYFKNSNLQIKDSWKLKISDKYIKLYKENNNKLLVFNL